MSLSVQEWIAVVGVILSILTTIIVPLVKKYKKTQVQKNNKKIQDQKCLNEIPSLVTAVNTLKEQLDSFYQDYSEFSTQNLKYMINDAYFCYQDIADIPDDILTNACECCEIYVNKRHKNHEIRPRCEKLWNELERRAVEKGGHHVQ